MRVVFLIASFVVAGSTVTVPWDEFRSLFGAQLQGQFQPPARRPPAPVNADTMRLTLRPTATALVGELYLSGHHVGGIAAALVVAQAPLIVTSISNVSGARALTSDHQVALLPDPIAGEY
jgi:hypothetical protein